MKNTASRRGGLKWYEILYALILVALLFFGLVLNRPYRVGVVDLEKVMSSLGISDVISEHRRVIQEDLKQTLSDLRSDYQQEYSTLTGQTESASSTDAGANSGMVALEAEARQQAGAAMMESRRVQQEALTEYRSRLQPYISEVANKRRLSLVLNRTSQALYVLRSIDVTQDVIDAARPDAETIAAAVPMTASVEK